MLKVIAGQRIRAGAFHAFRHSSSRETTVSVSQARSFFSG